MRMTLRTPADFDFLSAVCSHGFFMLAPNRWDPDCRTLLTVLPVDAQQALAVGIRAGTGGRVIVESKVSISPPQRRMLREGIRRMLRLDEDLSAFHVRCRRSKTHHRAARMRFGRLLRSATLFEDMVKVICTCNVTWRQTTTMVECLVEHWGLSAATGTTDHSPGRALRSFPPASALAGLSEAELRTKARVGYRARSILRLSRAVADGEVDLDALASFGGSTKELIGRLKALPGIGDYGASHVCMLLGRYDCLAVDTEMRRHLESRHPRRQWTASTIQQYYEAWSPYQFLAYWYELWEGYVSRHGKAHHWDADAQGRRITQLTPRGP